jgi:hypothetical protein
VFYQDGLRSENKQIFSNQNDDNQEKDKGVDFKEGGLDNHKIEYNYIDVGNQPKEEYPIAGEVQEPDTNPKY